MEHTDPRSDTLMCCGSISRGVQRGHLRGRHHAFPAEHPAGAEVQSLLKMDVTVAYSELFREHELLEDKSLPLDISVVNSFALTNLGKEAKRPGAVITEAVERKHKMYQSMFPTLHGFCQRVRPWCRKCKPSLRLWWSRASISKVVCPLVGCVQQQKVERRHTYAEASASCCSTRSTPRGARRGAGSPIRTDVPATSKGRERFRALHHGAQPLRAQNHAQEGREARILHSRVNAKETQQVSGNACRCLCLISTGSHQEGPDMQASLS